MNNINLMRTTYNKLNNHALVFIEITKAWLFFIIIITKLANKAFYKYNLRIVNSPIFLPIKLKYIFLKIVMITIKYLKFEFIIHYNL